MKKYAASTCLLVSIVAHEVIFINSDDFQHINETMFPGSDVFFAVCTVGNILSSIMSLKRFLYHYRNYYHGENI